MTERRRKVGLYDIVDRLPANDDLKELVAFANSAGIKKPSVRLREWIDTVERSARSTVDDKRQTESVREMAVRVVRAAEQARSWFEGFPLALQEVVAEAMERAADLADDWHALAVNYALETPVKMHRKQVVRGRAGGEKTRDNQKVGRNKRKADILEFMKKLVGGYEDKDILIRTSSAFGLAESTLRKRLPEARKAFRDERHKQQQK